MPKSGQDATAIFSMLEMGIPGRAKSLGMRLGKLEGVRLVDFNYIMDTVSIRYDGKKLTLDSIKNVIRPPAQLTRQRSKAIG
jgi:hypothetical protein